MANPTAPQGLALHTTTPCLGLALGDQLETLETQVTDLGRAMASELQFALAAFMAPMPWSSLDFLAVARGPGGFTGTRLGMVTTRTLAQQLDIPLFSLSTLAAIAQKQWQQEEIAKDKAIALDMRAQRGQRFTALYRYHQGLPEAIVPDQVCSPEAWQKILAEQSFQIQALTVLEDAAQAVGALWGIAQKQYLQGHRPQWQDALPFYGQHPVTL